MDYAKIYDALIAKFQNMQLEGYKERHHIVPKCMGGTNDKTNIVALTAKAHFVAHHLLHKIHPENRKLANAFGKMLCGSRKNERRFSPRMYEAAKKALSIAKKGIPVCDNRGRKRPDVSIRFKGRPGRKDAFTVYNQKKAFEGFTPEEIENKRKAGRARKGKVMSAEGKASFSSAALKRDAEAPMVTCSRCNHTQKRSVNFFRYHEKNCSK